MSPLFPVVALGVSLLIVAIFLLNADFIERRLRAWTVDYARWMSERFDEMFVEVSQTQCLIVILLATAAGAVLGYALYPSLLLAAFLGVVGWWIPRYVVNSRAKARREAFSNQLVDALVLLANSLRSGLSLLQSMRIVVSEMEPPLSDEFGLVLKEQRVSAHLDEALLHLNERMRSEDLDMVVTSILTLRETGGNLAETFDKVTMTIRERKRVEQKINALTAQGYLQGVMACLSPLAFLLLMWLMQPMIVRPLFTTGAGWALLSLAAVLDVIGFFVLKALVTIRV